jgi:hypothetical protein
LSKRIILLVEGHTEGQTVAEFLKRWLDERLAKPVGISTVRFEGWSELVREAPKRAELYLEKASNRQEIIAVVGLIDLYGPTFYPDHITTVKEKYAWGKKYIESMVAHSRYYQFFAVHEIEAWLISDLSDFPSAVQKAIADKAKRPETINFNEPPAKLLDRIYQRETKRAYKKVTEARNHFPKLDPQTAAEKCPYLKAMLESLLEIVQNARQ